MKKISIKDFLKKQVDIFIDEMVEEKRHKNYLKKKKSILGTLSGEYETNFQGLPKDFLDEANYRFRLLRDIYKANQELEQFADMVLKTAQLPRFNNDKVHAFLTQLFALTAVKFPSATGKIISDRLGSILDQMNQKPASEIDKLPDVLKTDQAQALWEKARLGNLVDDNYKPLVQQEEAAIIADRMSELLNITSKHRMSLFGNYWGITNLRQRLSDALNDGDYLDKVKKIRNIIY